MAIPTRLYPHGTGSVGPQEPASPVTKRSPILAAALVLVNPAPPQFGDAGVQGEALCATTKARYLLAGGVDFCRVEEINAVVIG